MTGARGAARTHTHTPTPASFDAPPAADGDGGLHTRGIMVRWTYVRVPHLFDDIETPRHCLSHGNLLNSHSTPALFLAFWAREGIKINLLTQLPRSGPELAWGFSSSSAVPCLVLGLPNAISPFPKLPGDDAPSCKAKKGEKIQEPACLMCVDWLFIQYTHVARIIPIKLSLKSLDGY